MNRLNHKHNVLLFFLLSLIIVSILIRTLISLMKPIDNKQMKLSASLLDTERLESLSEF